MKPTSKLPFSQREGYVKPPQRHGLDELPKDARRRILDVLYKYTRRQHDDWGQSKYHDKWEQILEYLLTDQIGLRLEDVDAMNVAERIGRCEKIIQDGSFNRAFDLIEGMLRHSSCPPGFLDDMCVAFDRSNLAYRISKNPTLIIVPSPTEHEGEVIERGIRDVDAAGEDGARFHLSMAMEHFRKQKWTDSVRESSHAVEAVCHSLSKIDTDRVGDAMKDIQKNMNVHGALSGCVLNLYGYASNAEGVRHARTGTKKVEVGIEEAMLMLSACSAACSFLLRKAGIVRDTEVPDEEEITGTDGEGEVTEAGWEPADDGDAEEVPF